MLNLYIAGLAIGYGQLQSLSMFLFPRMNGGGGGFMMRTSLSYNYARNWVKTH
ncbi:MAG: hypothetical protein KDA65_00965 [Planctomycetaceae bacterium]|nr:hypothetical protein [Planctomycetaceae bacterium]